MTTKSTVKPIQIAISESSAGLNPSQWNWKLTSLSGGVERVLAKGKTLTPSGAVYAATMEARLYNPDFVPNAQELAEYAKRIEVAS